MRSIFDQYDAPENRLTHALGCCLERDPRLLRQFIRWVCPGAGVPAAKLDVLEQQVPGVPSASWDEDEPQGLPDLWIHDGDNWALLVESKVKAKASLRQLHRHIRTAKRSGFADVTLLLVAPSRPAHRLRGVTYRTWPEVYEWCRRQAARSEWAKCVAEYMEIAEVRMLADGYLGDQPLTRFDGIPFGLDHPYSYREAKRVLRLALAELRKRPDLRSLGMDPTGKGRPAITGKEGASVWDFLALKEAQGKPNFTACPHLTLGIQARRVLVIVTLPNAVLAVMRRRLSELGLRGFAQLVAEVAGGVTRAVRPIKGARPFLEVIQRHYPAQRAQAIEDARLEFDPRTAGFGAGSRVKNQPQWLAATFDALGAKRSNLQVGIGAIMPYGDPKIPSRGILDVVAEVWVACRPWLQVLLSEK